MAMCDRMHRLRFRSSSWLLLVGLIVYGGLARADIEIGLIAPLTGPFALEGQLVAMAGSDVVDAPCGTP